ncbi:MAG TPA: tRNA (adenosine(37)-N6)-dimethylallyltransferase MiaA [Humidesulfovibrio sp.]|uniref:tRNA (adenosine(37)-N6)-dimethylallyltransferase MiaA n=1 Tax=Humidesulfovibrio sp. TaxID=2910988 RepID=UPI002BA17C78|nr:tRNA (adenosine(37)-N6)-dimethylallyltransferase MiaA [Humidesulfovibrio sp.]HWR03494.1 tRNA (adenosine(37)-N6)-dimethylallyltransferase MiaA [Humidesulfovibrio sp.]
MGMLRAVCILGPTGSGKTEAALGLARSMPVTVINYDSRQLYADFPIVTAQPEAHEQAQCPHRLYGFLPTAEAMSAARFAELARKEMVEAQEAGRVPVLVGGTGLYVKALEQGLADIPPIAPDVRQWVLERMGREGPNVLHEDLAQADPETAARLHKNDTQRIARALEVFLGTGKPLSVWFHEQKRGHTGVDLCKVGVSTTLGELEPRLRKRIGVMLERGAVDEVRRAWEQTPEREAPGYSGIGCAELLAHILGEVDFEETCDLWYRNTRAYAKRQLTWFAKEPGVRWIRAEGFDRLPGLVRAWGADCE